MNHVIRLRAEAGNDIDEAAAWYEFQRPRLGHEFLDAIEASLARISENPLQFPVVHCGIRRALLARFPFGVFFQVDDGQVVILAVLHASRDPIHWRERT